MQADAIWQGGGVATMAAGAGPYGAIPDGAVAVSNGHILWVGRRADLPGNLAGPATQHHDIGGGWLTPGLIDCHTHLIFAGDRSAEFEARLGGISYAEAAKSGRGILSTMAATRAATEAELVALATPRLQRLRADGVTTVEIKSGYGLSLPDELKMLRAARALGVAHGIRVRTTLLAAHATPPEFAGRPDAYIDHIVTEILPAAAQAGLADAVDAFAEIDRLFPGSGQSRFRRCAKPSACPSNFMPISWPTAAARHSPRHTTRSPPITLNTPPKPACAPWPQPARWRCCCPAPMPRSAPRSPRRSRPSATTTFPWPSPPTPTQAVPRC